MIKAGRNFLSQVKKNYKAAFKMKNLTWYQNNKEEEGKENSKVNIFMPAYSLSTTYYPGKTGISPAAKSKAKAISH